MRVLLFLVMSALILGLTVAVVCASATTPIPAAPKITQCFFVPETMNVEHVYYINLDSRPDRRYHIESQLARVGLDHCSRVPGVHAKFGALGCSQAHGNALRQFRDSGHRVGLITEDDTVFNGSRDAIQSRLNQFAALHIKWDVLLLAGFVHDFEKTDVRDLLRVRDAQTTACYLVNRDYAATLLANVEEGAALLAQGDEAQHDYCLDIWWKSLQAKDAWYFWTSPCVAFQRDDFSDILGKNVSYKDRLPLTRNFADVPIEYLVCVKTCQPRLLQNPKQTEAWKRICAGENVRQFYYLGANSQQTQDIVYDHPIVRLKCKDDYLNLCRKVGLMMRFLNDYMRANPNCEGLKGVFFTDDDIDINADEFYSFLEERRAHAYWGAIGEYLNERNRSEHLMQKARESERVRQLLASHYPDLLTTPVTVPKVRFCAGGGFFLQPEYVRLLAKMDEHFAAFPSSENLQFHKSCDGAYDNLRVFDDMEVGLALQSMGVLARSEPVHRIARW